MSAEWFEGEMEVDQAGPSAQCRAGTRDSLSISAHCVSKRSQSSEQSTGEQAMGGSYAALQGSIS